MKTKIYTMLLVVLALTLLVAACSSGAASPTTAPSTTSSDGENLFQERCTVCHTLSRIESQRLSAADWKLVVDAMIAKGAKLTADEETLVVDYLAANYGN
jgi:cytochrome c-type biogenesis protein CcmH/NrfF